MKRFKALTLVVVALICAVAVSVAFGAGAQKKSHAKVTAKVHQKASTAQSSGGEPAESTSETADSTSETPESSSAAETDGVDAGGDHQCPPDCAPGELP
jgi:hypothetical protein